MQYKLYASKINTETPSGARYTYTSSQLKHRLIYTDEELDKDKYITITDDLYEQLSYEEMVWLWQTQITVMTIAMEDKETKEDYIKILSEFIDKLEKELLVLKNDK